MTPQAFRQARRELDYSQARMGKALGLRSAVTIYRYEHGLRKIRPEVAHRVRLMLAKGV